MSRAILLPAATLVALLVGPNAATAQVQLEFKFPEGRKSTNESTVIADQTLTINGQPITTKSVRTLTVTTEFGTPRAGGVVPITQSLGAVKAELSLPGGIEMTIDSENPQDGADDLPQLAMVRKLIQSLAGIRYTVLLGPDGKVAGIEGIEEALGGDRDPEVVAALRQEFDAQNLAKNYEQEYAIFPKEPVGPGQTWEREEILDLRDSGTFTFQRTYAYEGTVERGGKTLDRIGITARSVDYKVDNPNSPLTVKSSDLKIASSLGEVLFDREAGEIVEGKNTTRMTGSLVLSAGGQDIPAELDLTLTTSSTPKPSK